jgi:hypothetical protein
VADASCCLCHRDGARLQLLRGWVTRRRRPIPLSEARSSGAEDRTDGLASSIIIPIAKRAGASCHGDSPGLAGCSRGSRARGARCESGASPPLSSSRSSADLPQKPDAISSPIGRRHRGAPGANRRVVSPKRRYLAASKVLRHSAEKAADLGVRRRGRSTSAPKVGHLSPRSAHSTSQIETAPITWADHLD